MKRSAGILLHLTSLPSPYGVGTLGREAYRFVDFLRAAGQTYWQILPVGPTSYGDSPYQSFSVYAGNPYLIDLDLLVEDRLLTEDEVENRDWGDDPRRVDYQKLYDSRLDVLRLAFARGRTRDQTEQERFQSQNAGWLKSYALFMALKARFGMRPVCRWPDEEIRVHNTRRVAYYQESLREDIAFWEYVQYLFFRQWSALRAYANRNGVLLLGDMPIYTALDSADVWANPEIFWLDGQGTPVCVAGCPPDYFSAEGQLWGNPLYRWDALKQTGYRWWMDRLAHARELFDVVRIDHFRAFYDYYAIPFDAKNAVHGTWMDGPGIDFFETLHRTLGDVPIIAEDLGDLSPGVQELRRQTGYPGMKVLQFAFDSGAWNEHLPHHYDRNCVVYTGTHDNDTVIGWLTSARPETVAYAKKYCRLTAEEGIYWGMIRTAYASVSDLAMVPMQDVLGLDSSGRMNTPSTLGENWQWRMDAGSASPELAEKLREMAETYGR